MAGTDIRTAFLAPRRDDSKTVVMVPAIFRECGLARMRSGSSTKRSMG